VVFVGLFCQKQYGNRHALRSELVAALQLLNSKKSLPKSRTFCRQTELHMQESLQALSLTFSYPTCTVNRNVLPGMRRVVLKRFANCEKDTGRVISNRCAAYLREWHSSLLGIREAMSIPTKMSLRNGLEKQSGRVTHQKAFLRNLRGQLVHCDSP
jgi:hypothetical protein